MIDLSTWNLSIPVGTPPATIDTPKLLSGFKGKYFQAEGSSVQFWSPVTGTRTENAIYPRSELRETYADGRLRNWTYPEADNYLRATLAINQVPSSGKIVIGQIHAYDSQKPLVKVEYQYKEKTQTGSIVAKVRMRPDDSKGRVIIVAENVPLQRNFTYVIHLNKAGLLSIEAANGQWNERLGAAWGKKPLYFKAGVYVQDNSGDSKEGGKVTFAKLDIDHN
ncbi:MULTISPECIES: polysaccharide lyase family 7 protein [unclassified Pseudomonas]|uniref:polysaccharide lyase family 7 protein n=1 Tax=unclassified Pseudomonas TaxID=196821 RepID=UPI0014727455|nr:MULTISPECIES: polysaccharide lyase family 7 protein [unclassified Pseudomonas]NMX90067.1 polysaccharide lyase family 7 protein [Pseudomonas sp. WS 5086]NMY44336.1 polysaccharide lyase family 7 protein [Pseudomonas sp. WS 5027]